MIFNSVNYCMISSWFCVHLCYMKKSSALVVLKGFCSLQRLDFQIYFNDCSTHIVRCWGCTYIAFLCRVIDGVFLFCSMALGKTLLPNLNSTVYCDLQGKWLYNTIASTFLVNYVIRYPFITYPLSDLSQTT